MINIDEEEGNDKWIDSMRDKSMLTEKMWSEEARKKALEARRVVV